MKKNRGILCLYSKKSDAATCRIAPAVMDNVTYDDAVMLEEIFGPIMPIITSWLTI